MNKKVLYAVVAVIVLGTAGYLFIRGNSDDEIKYRTEKVSRGDVTVQVRATGTINPVQTVQVGSQVSGTVSRILADFNSEVKKGQVIAEIDSTFLYASVKEAQANRERNQAQLNEAKRTLDRAQELFKKDLISQADLDAATTGYESAQAQLNQSDAALDRVRVNLRYAIIRAPIDGVVISRDVDVGQTVAASLQTPKLFSIANDLKSMRVEASVDEADIGQIKEGQMVTFTVDSYPNDEFQGTVTQVRLAPVTVQNVVTYTVIIDVPNPDLKLRPGMTATVSILIEKREGAMRIPTLALRFQPPPEVADKFSEKKSQGDTAVARGEQGQEQKGDGEGRRMGDGQRRRMGDGERGRMGDGERRADGMMGSDRREMWKQMRQGGGQSQMARVWILDNTKNLKPVSVRTGLNDNRYVEVVGGDLKEGDEIVIGSTGPEIASGPMQQTNPFQTRMPGGGGGGGRRGM